MADEERPRVWLGDQEITEWLSAADLVVTPWQADVLANIPPTGPLFQARSFSLSWSGVSRELFDLFIGDGWLRTQRRRRLSGMHAAYRRRHR